MLKSFGAKINHKIILTIGVAGVAVLGVSATYLYMRTQNNKQNDDAGQYEQTETDKALEESTNGNKEAIDAYSKELSTTTNATIGAIKSVEDLKKLDVAEQGRIGVAIINNLIATENVPEAQTYIDYVMTLQTGYGLEAAKLCYVSADNDSRKAECRTVVNQRAIEQEIIAEGESLPESYFTVPDGEGI